MKLSAYAHIRPATDAAFKWSKEEEGFLRPVPFEKTSHVLLQEELKHLYTAVTRAKSNVRASIVLGSLPWDLSMVLCMFLHFAQP